MVRFTLHDTDIDKKWIVQNDVKVLILHTDRRQRRFIGFCTNLSVSVFSVSVSASVSTPLDSKEVYQRSHLTNLKVLPRAANEYAPIFKAFPWFATKCWKYKITSNPYRPVLRRYTRICRKSNSISIETDRVCHREQVQSLSSNNYSHRVSCGNN